MRIDLLRLAVLGLATASLVSCADDQAAPESTEVDTVDGAHIHRAPSGPLTTASAASATAIVGAFVRDRSGATPDQLRLTSQSAGQGGVTHVVFEQEIDGMRVHGAYVKAAIGAQGELLQVIEKVAPPSPGPLAKAHVTERDALANVFAELGYEMAVPAQRGVHGNLTSFEKGSVFWAEPTAERVAYLDLNVVRQGYLVQTWSARGNQLDYTLVGSDGKVVSTERRTNTDRYNVFVEDPIKTPQTFVTGPTGTRGWLGTAAHTTHNISGNNTRTYLDTDANNAADSAALTGATPVTNGDFLTAANLLQTPSNAQNRSVAVQNLFYLNNNVHDLLYGHGFTEAFGNFQTANFGLGGAGNDPVNAEAQDGSGLDNANMATPTDGSSPRMQMYLWSGADGNAFVSIAGGSDLKAFSSSFGAALTTTGIAGNLALVNDGAGTTSDGCEASTTSLAGLVAVVDRGGCDFTMKVLNAQTAGATAVVIVNNQSGSAFSPGGTNRKVKISSAMVNLADRNTLLANQGVSARLRANPSPLRIDGDVDADIVYHEYGHGLTWRMIGGMSGPIAGALGEGASDTLAFLINGDDVIGEYSFADPAGIRSQRYATYVGSYATSVTGTQVHGDGELYAAIMWRLNASYVAAGISTAALMTDWLEGFKATPATPAYEHMRDGMLVAAPARACLIWKAFAHYGVGVGASGRVTQGGRGVSITESFAVPATCP